MMPRSRSLAIATLLLSLLTPQFATAQMPLFSQVGISATASERVSAKPIKLRLVMSIEAKGKDPASAIQSLAAHRDRVKKELVEMKASNESIQFSNTSLSTDGDSEQMQVQIQYQQMQMMMGGMAEADEVEAVKPPQVYTATTAVMAEWQLPVSEGDALALLPVSLKQQIETRDLAGTKNTPNFTDDEKEKMAEVEAMVQESRGYYSSSDEESKMQIFFVGSLDAAAVKAATKKAAEAAMAKAQLLAEASGIDVGAILAVQSNDNQEVDYASMYGRYGYGDQQGLPSHFISGDDDQVLSTDLDSMIKVITIGVSYAAG